MAIDNPIHRAITDFVNSANGPLSTVSCPDCESPAKYQNFVFSYGGQTWEIPFPDLPQVQHPRARPNASRLTTHY
jgi:hypothetical protein